MRIENIQDFSYNSINNPLSDYTAEAIATSLIKTGALPEQIILRSKGTFRRSYKKDVSSISTAINEDVNCTLFFLESPREGIYDALPESIFHSFTGIKSINNKEAIKEEIKRHREEEKQARLFFLPFEQEFFTIKRTLFALEETFDRLSHASSFIEIYTDYYPVLNDLSVEKGYLFLRLIPLIHDIRDDFPKVEACLSMLLDSAVRISVCFKKNALQTYTLPALGSSTLGINTIIGSIVEDGEPDLTILLTPIHSQSQDYACFQKQIVLTKQLCDFFIGAHYDTSVSYAFDGTKDELALDSSSVLGYGVYL